ncbi:hypothetical protein [Nocardia sp. NPDC051833]|uniref:hypothetical protein n=1 Tax=Nocardia sp. NPDC051833 TaxID=3155674 RepID=UPI003433E1EA
MKAVWLSSTYYLDPAINSAHPDAERLFTRALAYCGNAETRGFVPKSALKTFGIRSVSRRVSELIEAGIWVESDTDASGNQIPGYRFKAWAEWNGSGDDLLERRKSDRERQRKAREKKAAATEAMSRDKSRDVTPLEESREEKSTTYVPSAAYVSNADATDEPRRASADEATGPTVPPDGWKIVRTPTQGLSQPTRTELAIQAAAMLHAGVDADDIAAGLETWMSRPDARIGLFRHLVDDAVKARRAPLAVATPLAASDRKARDQAAIFDELRRKHATPSQSPLLQIVDAEPAALPAAPDWSATA